MMTKRTTAKTSSNDEPETHNKNSPRAETGELREGQTDWARLEAMTPEEVYQNALDDPDAQPLTAAQAARLRRVPNPKRIRQDMGLSQEQFARRFEIALGTLRDWEQGVRILDSTAKAYLRVIEKNPDAVVKALSREPVEAGTR